MKVGDGVGVAVGVDVGVGVGVALGVGDGVGVRVGRGVEVNVAVATNTTDVALGEAVGDMSAPHPPITRASIVITIILNSFIL